VETGADIAALARLFEGLRFPGAALADGALDAGEERCYFRCVEPGENPRPSFGFLAFSRDWPSRRFRDPGGFYPLLRELRDGAPPENPALAAEAPPAPWQTGPEPGTGRYRALTDGALILARYSGDPAPDPGADPGRAGAGAGKSAVTELAAQIQQLPADLPPGSEEQRMLLMGLLLSPRPEAALELLKETGFIGEWWPELVALDRADHAKEFHPEGNGWDHTLETFRHRKSAGRRSPPDLRLSLGLLLHDLGKPLSESSGNRRFAGHAELGARAARKFLQRLEFPAPLIEDIFYLVKNHMLPAALPRLPLQRTAEIMASPLFPTLMELYRCDESSSFKGLEGYYQSSAAYQSYLRLRRNPYRSADGTKLSISGRK
jgi:poly(A) polymerase